MALAAAACSAMPVVKWATWHGIAQTSRAGQEIAAAAASHQVTAMTGSIRHSSLLGSMTDDDLQTHDSVGVAYRVSQTRLECAEQLL